MAVTSSLGLTLQHKLCKKACKSCGLDIFQGPAFDQLKKSHIFWVGLSAVRFDDGEEKRPLSPLTQSGALIHSIEAPLPKQFSFYKTNLVKCVPLQDDKIRYPLSHEMEKCFPNFEWELHNLQPSIVFLLGKQVANFVFKKFGHDCPALSGDFHYQGCKIEGTIFIPVHHPSYILVYKRKQVEQYSKGIQKLITATMEKLKRAKQFHAEVVAQ